MSKDLLAEATRALREAEEQSELEARATRARVMSGLHQTRVRRRTRYAFLLPIAATFVAASAWGAASGKAQIVWASIARLVSSSPPARVAESSTVHDAAAQKPALSTPAPDPLAPAAAPAPALDTAPVARSPRTTAVSESVARANEASASASATPRQLADPAFSLYRAAHTAHFVDHDPARALAAWDAYLAAAPNGAFAPEAHYNRALSLVRLGRNSEAKSALEPFANGSYGGYRQAEASALLDRLGP